MERPEPKYKLGDTLKDLITGKVAVVTNMYCSTRDGWAYSTDHLGFFFLPEEDLIKVD